MINLITDLISFTQPTNLDRESLSVIESIAKIKKVVNGCITQFNNLEEKTEEDYQNFLNQITTYENEINNIINDIKNDNNSFKNEFREIIKALENFNVTLEIINKQSKYIQDLAKINQDNIDKGTIATEYEIKEINKSLKEKANKDSVFTMANMGQDIKVAMTGGSVAVVGENSILTENIVDKQVTPTKISFYKRESCNLYDVSAVRENYHIHVESIEDGVITTESLSPNNVFYLNVNPSDNVGKGEETLKAGTYYLKFKMKGTSGQTGNGSGIFPPSLCGSDAVRHDFTFISGTNSTDFTEWIFSITLNSDVPNYGFLFKNGNTTETYTIKNIFLTDNLNNEYEDYYTYYSPNNIKNKRYENYKNEISENKNSIKNIEDKLLTIENPKILHCGFIGDSLTEGDYGSLNGTINKHDENYPYYFKKATGWNGTNFGKCGWTTKDVWERIVSTMNLNIKYNIFIIMLGTNGGLTDTIQTDCTGNDYNNYANTQTGCYCKIVEHIMKNCPTAQIFLCTPPYNSKPGKCEYIVETGNVVKKIAQKYNIQVIDVYHDLGVNKLNENIFLPIDRLHFGQYGYQKLGVFLANKIKSNLSYYDI